jgi:polyphosphate kinase 2
MLNPKLKEGDRIVLIYLDDPYSHIPVGTKGTVVKIQNIPFPGKEDYNYMMKWDNGSTLALEPDTDSWILEKDTIKESVDELNKKLIDNEIEVENLSDLISKLDDDKVTDFFLRNLDRKLLKGGDKTENVRKYISKYIDSLQQRTNNQDSSDTFDVEDEFVYGGLEPEKSAIGRKQFKKELIPLQVELLKLQEHVKRTGKPVVIILEGRDSAGKGSTIKFLTEYLDPKFFKVVVLGIATPEERKNWFARYENQIEPGKINFFDRSWYNRGIVEPVMGYGTEEEYFDFMNNVNKFEQSLVDKGMKLFKFWLSITPQTQKKRFELRKNSPLKYWKFSPNDEKSIDKWDDYTNYKEKVLKQTRDAVPWTVVDTNDKHAGVLNLLRHLLTNVEYSDKDLSHIGDVYPEVVTTIKETR